MSRDTGVYAKQKTTVSIDQVVEALSKRGLPVTWTQLEPIKPAKPTKWISGYLLAQDETEQKKRIEMNTFKVMKFMKKDIANQLDEKQYLEDILAAETKYNLSVTSELDARGETILVNLADVLAELTDGIIQEDRFYTRQEFREANRDQFAN